MREELEYGLVRAVAGCLGRMPRRVARLAAGLLAFTVYGCMGRLRQVGARNLEMALPEVPVPAELREKVGEWRRLEVDLALDVIADLDGSDPITNRHLETVDDAERTTLHAFKHAEAIPLGRCISHHAE